MHTNCSATIPAHGHERVPTSAPGRASLDAIGRKEADIAGTPPSASTPASQQGDIDLGPAAKVVRDNPERIQWLREMQEPEGMSPGSSRRAHARAFRFAEALMKAGYRVIEAPLGPRGGRRFVLVDYDGPRAGLVYRLKQGRGCSFDHSHEDCGCFDDLSVAELKLVAVLHRKANGAWGRMYGTDQIGRLVHAHPEEALRSAVDLHVTANCASAVGGPTIEEYLVLLERYDLEDLRAAVQLFARAGGTRSGGADVHSLVAAIAAAAD